MLTWLIEQIVLIFMKLIFMMMIILVYMFIGDISFANGPQSLTPYLDTLFGKNAAQVLASACIGLACFMLVINHMIQIFRCMTENEQNTPSPIKVAISTSKNLILACMWFPLTKKLIFPFFSSIYKALIGASLAGGITNTVLNNLNPADAFMGVYDNLTGAMNGSTALKTVSDAIILGTGLAVPYGIIIALFMGCVLFKTVIDFFKMMVDVVQRLVILSIFWIFAPLAFGMGNNVKWEDIPKLYLKTFISQLVAVIFYHFWVLVIVNTMLKIGGTTLSAQVGIIVLMAVVQFGRSIDGYLGQIGLRTSNEGARLGDTYGAYAAAGAKLGAMGAYTAVSSGTNPLNAFRKAKEGGAGTINALGSALGETAKPISSAIIASSDTAQFLTAAASKTGPTKMAKLAQELNRGASQLRAQQSLWGMDRMYSGKDAASQMVSSAIAQGKDNNSDYSRVLSNTDIQEQSIDTNGNAVIKGLDKSSQKPVGYTLTPDGKLQPGGANVGPQETANAQKALQKQKSLSNLPSEKISDKQKMVCKGKWEDGSYSSDIEFEDSNGITVTRGYGEIEVDSSGNISVLNSQGYMETYNDSGEMVHSMQEALGIEPESDGSTWIATDNGMGAARLNKDGVAVENRTIMKTSDISPKDIKDSSIKPIENENMPGYSRVTTPVQKVTKPKSNPQPTTNTNPTTTTTPQPNLQNPNQNNKP